MVLFGGISWLISMKSCVRNGNSFMLMPGLVRKFREHLLPTKNNPPSRAHSMQFIIYTLGKVDSTCCSSPRFRNPANNFSISLFQSVMSSVLVDSSEIAELHTVLDKLTVASSGAGAQILSELTEQMQTILHPYQVCNLHQGFPN